MRRSSSAVGPPAKLFLPSLDAGVAPRELSILALEAREDCRPIDSTGSLLSSLLEAFF
jgi:hypothetical protein